jgi:hypothetical protein
MKQRLRFALFLTTLLFLGLGCEASDTNDPGITIREPKPEKVIYTTTEVNTSPDKETK